MTQALWRKAFILETAHFPLNDDHERRNSGASFAFFTTNFGSFVLRPGHFGVDILIKQQFLLNRHLNGIFLKYVTIVYTGIYVPKSIPYLIPGGPFSSILFSTMHWQESFSNSWQLQIASPWWQKWIDTNLPSITKQREWINVQVKQCKTYQYITPPKSNMGSDNHSLGKDTCFPNFFGIRFIFRGCAVFQSNFMTEFISFKQHSSKSFTLKMYDWSATSKFSIWGGGRVIYGHFVTRVLSVKFFHMTCHLQTSFQSFYGEDVSVHSAPTTILTISGTPTPPELVAYLLVI